MSEQYQFEAASESDLASVLQILSEADLPSDGVAENLKDFMVARCESGQIIGVAGIERHGKIGLLRSVAVSPDWRKSGVGSRLVAAILQKARGGEIERVVLLTTTARNYFARQFGFSETTRENYDANLKDSVEWALPRCSTAAVMELDLENRNSTK